MFDTRENRIGALSGLVACVLVLALTVMALTALEPPRQTDHAPNWDVSLPEASPIVKPSF